MCKRELVQVAVVGAKVLTKLAEFRRNELKERTSCRPCGARLSGTDYTYTTTNDDATAATVATAPAEYTRNTADYSTIRAIIDVTMMNISYNTVTFSSHARSMYLPTARRNTVARRSLIDR
ncbi:hypothetical protein ALC56_14418 [Trachymyrmex septentrionalis]|uniref:Uncharacterized protein n=1 Tax=Trachymyrmex septentrionalis TaxID=34720 RepID=A0A195EUG1_9HYME|nr:hypothetical protein ALC56_14418 [Trachymyrmex septentrionalis]